MTRADETAPWTYARIRGTLCLYMIVAALFGEVIVRGQAHRAARRRRYRQQHPGFRDTVPRGPGF